MHLLRLVILAVSVLFAPLTKAAEEYTYPPGAEPPVAIPEFPGSGVHRYDQVTVPDERLFEAHDAFTSRYIDHHPTNAANLLRLFALEARLDKVRDNLAWAVARDWDEDFLELFRQAIAWGDHIWHSDGAYVWEQAQAESRRATKITGNDLASSINSHLASMLGGIAIRKGYQYAIYRDCIDRGLNAEDAVFLGIGEGYLCLSYVAYDGYELAVQELIERLLTGNVLPKHAGAAYFWFRFGERQGYDVNPWRSRVERAATEVDRSWADAFTAQDRFPKFRDLRR